MIVNTAPQGSAEWLVARLGCITGSRAKDARDKLKNGTMSAKAILYAQDVARERCGGLAAPVFVNDAMRKGTEEEPMARMAYEVQTGAVVEEAGFICDDDHKIGCSVDGLVGDDGMIEIKTLVSSGTLFTAMVDGDVSGYLDQIQFALWLLTRQWCDLCLWAPDLPAGRLKIVRIYRDQLYIDALESDLAEFEAVVAGYEAKLRQAMTPNSERIAS